MKAKAAIVAVVVAGACAGLRLARDRPLPRCVPDGRVPAFVWPDGPVDVDAAPVDNAAIGVSAVKAAEFDAAACALAPSSSCAPAAP